MLSKSTGEGLAIAVKSNWLTVNGSSLRADVLTDATADKLTVSSDELLRILLLGRRTILQAVEVFYEQQVLKNPDLTVGRASVFTAQLGTEAQTDGKDSEVFTEKGYDNGGVNSAPDEIQPRFRDYWHAVRHAGFVPEVRRTSGSANGGSWLALRKPSLDDVLVDWFDQRRGMPARVVDRVKDESEAEQRRLLLEYRIMSEEKNERQPDAQHSRAQIGLILSMAAIKLALEDTHGYEVEIDDALTFADNDATIEDGAVRAIENSTFEMTES